MRTVFLLILFLSFFSQACTPKLIRTITPDEAFGTSSAVLVSGPAAVFSIALNTFSNTFVGSANSATFTLTNTGTATGTVTSRSLTTGTSFSITGGTCTATTTVAVNATCTVIIQYTPLSISTVLDTINVAYNDGTSAQTATRIIYSAALSELSFLYATQTEYPAGATVSSSGVISLYNNANVGDSATITAVSLVASPNFSIIAGGDCTVAAVISHNATCTVNVSFSPLAPLTINTTTYLYDVTLGGTLRLSYTKGGIAKTTDMNFTLNAAPFQSGLGTIASPHIIHDEYQFRVHGQYCEHDVANDEMSIDANIDLGGLDGAGAFVSAKKWSLSNAFTCKLEGGGHTISNFYFDGGVKGIYDSFSGTVQNLTINNFKMINSAVTTYGIISGGCENGATISGVTIGGAVAHSIDYSGVAPTVGGLCGTMIAGRNLVDSGNSVTLTVQSSTNKNATIGGLIGSGDLDSTGTSVNLTITASVNTATNVGGFIGEATYFGITNATSVVNFSPINSGNGCGGLIGTAVLSANSAVS